MSFLKRAAEKMAGAASSAALRDSCKIVCIGRNYADHVAELSSATPKQPFFFLKPPTSILQPGRGPCLRPKGVELHHEVELALVVGRVVRDLRPDEDARALAAITGYAVALDMTARNVQAEAKRKALPWAIAKGFDTFLPMGAVIPASAVPDPRDVELFLEVNGEVRQRGSTRDMVFGITRILSDISRVMTLNPGDLVLTGTPAGVGPVVPGDVIRAGLRVDGGTRELEDGRIEVAVEEARGDYEYTET